jgi:hypothetical protein
LRLFLLPRNPHKLGRFTVSFMLLAFALAGCSLSDYESAMKSQQDRADYQDRQDQVVSAEPIAWTPPQKQGDAAAVGQNDLFYRPLKGISATADKDLVAKMLVRYKAIPRSKPFKEMLVAAEKNIPTDDDFRKKVLKALEMSNPTSTPKPEIGAETGRPMRFDYYHTSRPGSSYVYFYNDQGFHIAIAYRPVQDATEQELRPTEAAMDYSLATLAVGLQASKRATFWKKSQGGQKH